MCPSIVPPIVSQTGVVVLVVAVVAAVAVVVAVAFVATGPAQASKSNPCTETCIKVCTAEATGPGQDLHFRYCFVMFSALPEVLQSSLKFPEVLWSSMDFVAFPLTLIRFDEFAVNSDSTMSDLRAVGMPNSCANPLRFPTASRFRCFAGCWGVNMPAWHVKGAMN